MRAFTIVLLMVVPAILNAQQPARTAVLYGSVLSDPNDRPLAGADVLIGTTLVARTDSTGSYTLRGIPAGVQHIVVRHLGNKPIATIINFTEGESLARDFILELDPASLDTVYVVGTRSMPPLGLQRMAGFDDRRKMGFGRFIDSMVFQREQSRRLVDILRSYVSVRVNEWSGSAAISSRSGNLSVRQSQLPSGDPSDRRAGARPACYSQVFLDGMKVYEPAPNRTLFDLNSVSPAMLIGAEFYSGPAGTPAMYGGLGASCGTLLLWTRQ